MRGLRTHFIAAFLVCFVAAPSFAQATATPANLKVAFTGDQGLGSDPEEVLRLVLAEGAEALFIQGDFDYSDDPAAWEAMLDGVLGPDFPVIAVVGNHDEAAWYGAGGYQERLTERMQRTGVPWLGELGVQATVNYKGLFVVQTAPDIFDGFEHAAFIRKSLADDHSIWSISGWHKLMSDMQVGGKGDEVGWPVYEESRRGGAIIATAHEHSYSRTHLLSNMESQTVASTAQPLVLVADDAGTTTDEGRSFAFVSGLGGNSIRDQERTGDWWASVYTSNQDASNGALFAVFNVNDDPRLAHFYFKDVTGKVADDFMVRSSLDQAGPPTPTTSTTTTVPPTTTTTTTTSTTAPPTTTTSTTAPPTTTTSTTAPPTTTTSTTTTTTATTSTTATTAPPTTTTTSTTTTTTTTTTSTTATTAPPPTTTTSTTATTAPPTTTTTSTTTTTTTTTTSTTATTAPPPTTTTSTTATTAPPTTTTTSTTTTTTTTTTSTTATTAPPPTTTTSTTATTAPPTTTTTSTTTTTTTTTTSTTATTAPPPTTTSTTLPSSAKATVCHGTGSGRGSEIEVSRNALAAHLKHGDTVGPCPSVAGQSQALTAAAPSDDPQASGAVPSSAQSAEEVSIVIDPPLVPTLAQGLVTVAILTMPGFDPADLQEGSVCFGAAADAALRDCTEAHGRDQGHLGDADGDGDLDLVLHYEPAATGIAAGERRACLSGETTQGLPIEGCGDLAVTP